MIKPLDWLLVGGEVHGVHLAIVLLCGGRAGGRERATAAMRWSAEREGEP